MKKIFLKIKEKECKTPFPNLENVKKT